MSAPTLRDPLLNYSFTVWIAGGVGTLFSGAFQDVSALTYDVAKVEYKTFNAETGAGEVQYMPGRVEPGTVVLKRGITGAANFWLWPQQVVTGAINPARASMSIYIHNRMYLPMLGWNFFNVWPTKFALGALDATQSGFLIEEMTLVYERVELAVVETS